MMEQNLDNFVRRTRAWTRTDIKAMKVDWITYPNFLLVPVGCRDENGNLYLRWLWFELDVYNK